MDTIQALWKKTMFYKSMVQMGYSITQCDENSIILSAQMDGQDQDPTVILAVMTIINSVYRLRDRLITHLDILPYPKSVTISFTFNTQVQLFDEFFDTALMQVIDDFQSNKNVHRVAYALHMNYLDN